MNLDTVQTSNVSSTFLTPPSSDTQQRHSYYLPPSTSKENIPQAKRARSVAYNDELNPEDADLDSEPSPSDQKDSANRPKLWVHPKLPVVISLIFFRPRACARCKKFKVKCEAKTETEPCKRCLNGGHECVIPGRKIRRIPP